ncbi:alpha/beta hydrolase family protein [Flexithrix dorotheae]|uniref:alpha/beta hydrolase family protein n=1 Tax=Flexithrix dorotheae TaxID=70993 RepID=UPI0003647327|nr:acetylxylan esterase [Flexithrix dorotheae]
MAILKFKLFIRIFLCASLVLGMACTSKKEFPVSKFYEYDFNLPLQESVDLISDSTDVNLYAIKFTSAHNKRVSGLFTVPKNYGNNLPVIILLHGLGDRKTVDYIEAGHQLFIDSGYAVLRIDIANHGERQENDYEFDLKKGYKYWTRDIITQTVFDLRRSLDFLQTRGEIDPKRIGYFGISLGGIIGTIFCGVDNRVKVPVIALAGGNLSLMLGLDAFTEETKNFFSIIDPVNYVDQIAPRPLLMINAENDEVIDPLTSKLLFQAAEEPKKIIWYSSKHRDLPVEKAYTAGISWFQKHL